MEGNDMSELEDVVILLNGIFAAQMRTYDVLLVLLKNSSPEGKEQVQALQNMHRRGNYYFPPADLVADAPAPDGLADDDGTQE